FRNDEPGAGALGIVEGVQLVWHVLRPGAAARQRCHDDTVPEREWSYFDRAEEIGAVIGMAFSHGQFSEADHAEYIYKGGLRFPYGADFPAVREIKDSVP